MTTGTVNSIRWLRRFLNHCFVSVSCWSLIEPGSHPIFLERSESLLFNSQFQSFKLLLRHALQSHRCGQMQGWNVLHFVAVFYLATEFLYLRVSTHFQKHFISIGNGQGLFNQAMLNQNAMI